MRTLPTTEQLRGRAMAALRRCGSTVEVDEDNGHRDGTVVARTPITGGIFGRLTATSPHDVTAAVERATRAFGVWRETPAPARGTVVRRLGELLREHKADLAELVTIEVGKIRSEGLGEVQEMIDICDYAVGLSRQLCGRTIASERPGHRLMETWHPYGVTAVITAFNFPVAVWSWNAAVALVCGNPVLWKPSDQTPLTALACQALIERAAHDTGAPPDLNQVLLGGRDVGQALVDDGRVPLVSATGSTAMGRAVAPRVAARFGRSILELGGNNAAVVTPTADLELATRAIVFAAVGTAGQRCTSLRRLIVHRSVHDELVARLAAAYGTLPIGDPSEPDTLVGPLINALAHERMRAALATASADGGTMVTGGERVTIGIGAADAYYVEPPLVTMPRQTDIARTETFAPLLYVLRYDTFADAIELHNSVPQGLASSIFTRDLQEAERFLSSGGSDCGIANVNIGPSGAEIGGAFGGEKETGGGRESGSDAWKAYMRRATNTVNYSNELPLAQGVVFT